VREYGFIPGDHVTSAEYERLEVPMINNISYNNKETTASIDEHVGKPFGIRQRIRLGGIGSPRFRITDASPSIREKISNNNNMINYCNIELRPEGIVLGFRALLETYAWSIPYYKLSIHSIGKRYILYSDTEFIKIENDHSGSTNASFMRKLRGLQTAYLGDSYIDYP
jgi:hypothetical protein